jgi:hypothetical protein
MREHISQRQTKKISRSPSQQACVRMRTMASESELIRNAYRLALNDPRFAPMKEAILVKDGKLTEEGIRRGIKL